MRVDPAAFRQTLLDSITDDGLEELTLRLAKPTYPAAHRVGPGRDDGYDVLSDMEVPPQRAWQAKNHSKIDWDACRESLAAAMSDEHPPPHYTFVFPRPLTARQRNFWREKFKPEQLAKYAALKTLDFWDDLAERLESHPELVDSLTDGALASYIRQVNAHAARTGASVLAGADELVGDSAAMAQRAVEVGKTDPRFRYETRQREARRADRDIPDGIISFGFRAPSAQPREFTVTVRVGDAVEEFAAEPREDVELPSIAMWFSETPRGDDHRTEIRRQLALSNPVTVTLGPDVGLDPRPLPDRFKPLADPDGILRTGETELGLSESVMLTIVVDGPHGQSPAMPVELRRVPSAPGYDLSYGGNVHGVLVYFELQIDATPPPGVQGRWAQSSIALELAIDQRPATDALVGLGFALAVTRAEHLHLDCAGVIPEGGVDFDDAAETAVAAGETLDHALMLADALARLEARDGRPRPVPATYSPDDLIVAQLIEALSHGKVARVVVPGGVEVRVGDTFVLHDAESGAGPLGPLGGHPTVDVTVMAEDPGATRLNRVDRDGRAAIRVETDGKEAPILVALASPKDGNGGGVSSSPEPPEDEN